MSISSEWGQRKNKLAFMNTISIQVPSMVENIRMIESFIDIYGNIMIAVTEAVNNAIKHGNNNNKTKNVHLSLALDESVIKFVIRDEGDGFNYDHLPDPTSPENLEKPGGRGIFLMKHLSDEVAFKDNGRTVELSFYVNA